MSKKCILFILLIFSIINTLLSQDLNLMPLPNSVI
jgi:cytochrome c biogenesis protein ResB